MVNIFIFHFWEFLFPALPAVDRVKAGVFNGNNLAPRKQKKSQKNKEAVDRSENGVQNSEVFTYQNIYHPEDE